MMIPGSQSFGNGDAIPTGYIKVLIVGGQPTTCELIKVLYLDPAVLVSGVVTQSPSDEVKHFLERHNIIIYEDIEQAVKDDSLDVIFNVEKNPQLHMQISRAKASKTVLIGQKSIEMLLGAWSEDEQTKMLQNLLRAGRKEGTVAPTLGFVMGRTNVMREISQMINQVAPTPTTVLIRGESGTGKELIARLIHQRSPWRMRPLITVNCTAFSASLIESELFGYKKGAFTGANSDRIGLLELADQGTVFLDEIGDMPVEMQSKLLRFLQSGEIRRVGDHQTRKVNVRIVAATNRDLEEAMERGEFRKDLFYRLNAFTIYCPPLRQRKEDIPDLINHFLRSANQRLNKHVEKITPIAHTVLRDYHWPGNIRELRNVIERAVVMAEGNEIDIQHLPPELCNINGGVGRDAEMDLSKGLLTLRDELVNRVESELIKKYLKAYGGNVSHAAEAAKVPRRTFQRLMSKHNILSSRYKDTKKID